MIDIRICDARSTPFPSAHFHACITSPPYFGLRRYGSGAAEIGAEASPDAYVASLVAVGREVRRTLRDDGVWWLNLGDTYSGGGSGPQGDSMCKRPKLSASNEVAQGIDKTAGLPSKNLLLIPARVALALQADGWIVRAEIPWLKRNVMPGSQQDRPTVGHETIYLLTKGPRYFFDLDAVRRANTPGALEHFERYHGNASNIAAPKATGLRATGAAHHQNGNGGIGVNPAGRSWRTTDPAFDSLADLRAYLAHVADVEANGGMLTSPEGDPLALAVNTTPSRLKHFAMWPPRLVAEMVKAGTSEHGCCEACGAPWRRVVEHKTLRQVIAAKLIPGGKDGALIATGDRNGSISASNSHDMPQSPERRTVGWQPTCSCSAPIVPCRILDPFSGAGTTAAVAEALGRDGYGCELNPAYAALSDERRSEVRAALLDEQAAPKTSEQQVTIFDLLGGVL